MTLSLEQLTRIVQQSSSFTQRIYGDFEASENHLDERQAEKLFHQWQEIVAYGSSDLLEKRFAWDGLEMPAVRQALNTPVWKPENALPAWASTLNEIMATAAHLNVADLSPAAYPFLSVDNNLPFQELFVPFILVAQQALQSKVPAHYDLFSPAAHSSIQRSLLKRLSQICQQTLYLEFSILRSKKLSRLSLALGNDDNQDKHNPLYLAFIHSLFAGGFGPFFTEYTVLARLATTAMHYWVEANAELIQRLAADLPAIRAEFALPDELGVVSGIKSSLSDPHNDGRSVSILTFGNEDFKLVYKPKNVGMDAAFSNLLMWVNERGASLELKALKIIDREQYGWVEFVETAPCQDEEAARRYYERIGMLLCLLYLFEGTDCHNENIIAAGEHPVLIDMETLLHPRIAPTSNEQATNGAQNLAHQQYLNSVLRTALLPSWAFGQSKQGYDISGLGAMAGQIIPYQAINWLNVNTDHMKVKRVQLRSEMKPATPFVNDQATSADDYLENIVAGFQNMYHIMMQHQKTLLDAEYPLTYFRQKKGRFVLRHTLNYFMLLEKLLQPQYMRSGLDYSIQLDALHKAGLREKRRPAFWPLIKAEVQAMESLDIPYFASCATDQSIRSGDGLFLRQFFDQAGYELMHSRIVTLNCEDMERQIGFIRAAFRLRYVQNQPNAIVTRRLALADAPLLAGSDFQQVALDIAGDIARQAILASNGTASWLGFEHVLEAERSVIQPLGYNLHSGTTGIALFLAAVERISGGAGYRELSLGAIQQMRNSIRRDPEMIKMMTQRMSLGGAIGLGGIIYGLARIHDLLDEPTLLEDAQLVADCITLERIAADSKFDVMDGTAGALLALLTLYKFTQNGDLLTKAVACGRRLLDGRTASSSGERVWATVVQEYALTGFSHGVAGIAYALLRLYELVGDEALCEAAVEAMAYENRYFMPAQQNWIDLLRTSEAETVYGRTWCHGAPGIGLARLGGSHLLHNQQVQQDIYTALEATQKMFDDALDTVCCGNLGRSELFVTAASKLNDPHLKEMALRQASWIVARRQESGSYRMPYGLGAGYSHDYQLGFFHGLAGIGYQLLRIGYPEVLPSVMLWE